MSSGQDDRAQSALADGLHVSEGDLLGLVLSLHRAGRLLTVHCSLEGMGAITRSGHRNNDVQAELLSLANPKCSSGGDHTNPH
jgi:hypothetical protein